MELRGKVAAVTGAGSGIGRAVALELARRGCQLAVSDIDADGLASTVSQLEAASVPTSHRLVDVADRQAVEDWAGKVVAEHGRANVIVNNAGVALGATVEAMSYDDFEWLMGINFWGVVHGTKAFLPHLKAAGEGHIVNVSSVFGLVGVPSQSAYNAAKFAVRGFTEALRIELDSERANVSCTTIHPGGIKTNIARNARFDDTTVRMMGQDPDRLAEAADRAFLTTPEKAARVIVGAMEGNKRRAFIGPDAHAFRALSQLPPGVYQNLIRLGTRLGSKVAR
jgi:butyryl-CoA dehydrogenase